MANTNIQSLRIDGERLWARLMEMARIGATAQGGCNRQALTDLDRAGRDLFVGWCREARCTVSVDRMGNIFARRAGLDDSLPPVLTGSHLDTQPTGGRFDGVYGVLAGLEVIQTLNDAGLRTRAPLEVAVWTNEEGARFSPAMIGSGVWAGAFDLAYGHGRTDRQGLSIGNELERIGYLGDQPASVRPLAAAFEVHIEQGPILEAEGLTVGVVTGVQGIRWYDLTLTGQPVHAGPTPMTVRRDPFMGLAGILPRLYRLAEEHGPWARVTFGDIRAEPGSRNTVPERLVLAVDLRHPEQAVLDRLDAAFRAIVAEEAERLRLAADIREEWHSPAVAFDADCVAAVQGAVEQLGYSHMPMCSGAGHDSVYLSRVAPTSMIFVPCKGGISHNEAEDAAPADLEAGANVLLHAMLRMAHS
ncbi:Zn-dependent hydrolase [Metapseudomonas resinovorans]|uniref:Putative N-carbamoyl-beta-alanine amidohydrolase n=1 Tax=Metapseudomonas resinovorans NBRC 106553 TaxID=1245471 RepID=S6BGG0_METRE|nr:Zn-dependent hydrolase [Pseudomonas resinovorans]BAN48169.1 putative N-carbamoyl-beta-alanine amidohydrolase [Pseudomonas resinovorans NBRC 106553]